MHLDAGTVAAVGQWYDDLSPTSDEEVRALLARAPQDDGPPGEHIAHASEVAVPVDGAVLSGDLVIPDHAGAIVMFAHGNGSSRHSPRNRKVGASLNRAGIATLLVDLLTPSEEAADRTTEEVGFGEHTSEHQSYRRSKAEDRAEEAERLG